MKVFLKASVNPLHSAAQRATRIWTITWDILGPWRWHIRLFPYFTGQNSLSRSYQNVRVSNKCPNYQSVLSLQSPSPPTHTHANTVLPKTTRNNTTYQWFSKCDIKRITRKLTPMSHTGISKSESLGMRLSNVCFNKSSV